MAENDPANSNPTQDNPTPPAGDPNQNPPGTSSAQTPPDHTKMAEELGKLKAENEALKKYQEQVDPVLQTIWSDQELLKKATEVHNKRLGITPQDKLENPPLPSAPDPKLQNSVTELRNNEIVEKVNDFYQRHGLDKLPNEEKKNLNTEVGRILMDILDPMGNKKDLKEALEDVPINKLNKFLEDAYFLATKDKQLEEARSRGIQEASVENRGIIGSMPSQSANPDTITLTAQEKAVAAKAGWDEKKYLEMKKYIATRPQQGIY